MDEKWFVIYFENDGPYFTVEDTIFETEEIAREYVRQNKHVEQFGEVYVARGLPCFSLNRKSGN